MKHYLILYYRSGWAFFVPYLATYLLYAWFRWPVNAIAGEEIIEQGAENWIPCLLHVYWALHVIHLGLGVISLRSWWQGLTREKAKWRQENGFIPYSDAGSSACAAYRPLPWLCLALVLWIPGAYLEFPADSWAHFSRITEWSNAREISHHSVWEKTSYFTAYSLVGWLPKTSLPAALDCYQTVFGMLLLWNYYRLGLQVGLQRQGAFLFAAIQPVLFGSSIFTFVRYYGLSSTLFSQLAVVALVRVALELACKLSAQRTVSAQLQISGRKTLALGLLAAMISFNHRQGFPLAAASLLAVGLWQVISHCRHGAIWLLAGVLVSAGLAFIWLPRHPAITEVYLSDDWLNFTYGFNILIPSSPAFERAAQILGLFGALNLAAGFVLVYRNHVAGWLTVTPILLLLHPGAAIPLANYLAARNPVDIVMFHRLLLAIPCGLAFLVLAQESWHLRQRSAHAASGSAWSKLWQMLVASTSYCMLVGLLLLGLILPNGGPWYSRIWHAAVIAPRDLTLYNYGQDIARLADVKSSPGSLVIGSAGLSFVFNTFIPAGTLYDPLMHHRLYFSRGPRSPSGELRNLTQTLMDLPGQAPTLLWGRTSDLITPYSLAAVFSRHWSPQEVALSVAGRRELVRNASETGTTTNEIPPDQSYFVEKHAGGGLVGMLRPVMHRFVAATEGPKVPSRTYTANLPQLPAMNSGTVSVLVTLAATERRWANLAMIETTDSKRGVYLYVHCETGALYYEFFGRTAGPFPADILPGAAEKTVCFIWSSQGQWLLVDGRILAHTTFTAPKLAAAKVIRLGWVESNDADFWRGTLHPGNIWMGGSPPDSVTPFAPRQPSPTSVVP